MKNVVVISQAITQDYLDIIEKSLFGTAVILITGSNVQRHCDNIKIIQSPQHDSRSIRSRFTCWIKHYFFIMRWARKNRRRNIHMIFATSNPPINSFIGLKIAKRFSAKFVYMNWDLYPQVVERSISKIFSLIPCYFWKVWNSKYYPKIDCMLTVGDAMEESINMQMKHRINIKVIPIGVNTEYIRPIDKKMNPLIKKNNFQGKFIVLYSGKMGYGHNIEMILECARKMSSNKNILFLFIGDGPKRALVEKYIEENITENVVLWNKQDYDAFPYSIGCGDIGIASQEKLLSKLFMPSKAYSHLACGQPIIGVCSEKDDLGLLISNNKVGMIVDSSDSLKKCILHYFTDKNNYEATSRRARELAVSTYSYDRIIVQYQKLFSDILR